MKDINEQLQEAIQMADAHLDAIGVPEDSLNRSLVHLQLALNQNPPLLFLCQEMYPSTKCLVN